MKLRDTARFARLQVEGAFLLSGGIRSAGIVSGLAITSEAGRPCNLVWPWQGPVRVRRVHQDLMTSVDVAEKDGGLMFPTAPKATCVVDRPDESLGGAADSCRPSEQVAVC